jgi:hypothetical protein
MRIPENNYNIHRPNILRKQVAILLPWKAAFRERRKVNLAHYPYHSFKDVGPSLLTAS